MRSLTSAYDFYRMDEAERIAMIGTSFREIDCDGLFFPVQLEAGEFNYGIQQGLIYVSPIMRTHDEHLKWFRVAAFSPDDLDLDLDFSWEYTFLRQDIIEFIRKMNKKCRTYRGILMEIQKEYNAGEIS